MRSWLLPACITVFATVSLVTIGSVRSDLLLKQAGFFILGGSVYLIANRVPFSRWLEWRWWIYVGVLFLLTLPLLLGHSSRNTSRWIELGFMRLQPSQLAIPLAGLSAVWLLDQAKLSLKRILLFLLSLVPVMALIFISPDLGTTVVYLAVLLSLLWFAGISLRHLTAFSAIGISMLILSWVLLLKPYQLERMLSFIAGTQQADQQHYNAAQALIAVGNGTVTGTGWGRGTQSHLQFLPERQTDFIFSSFAEEYGFVGTSAVIILFVLTSLLLFYFALQVHSKAASLYLLMTAATIFLQAGVNIGMNIGLLPITGVTLPLVSYGGSSILATCLMLGITSSILRNQEGTSAKILT